MTTKELSKLGLVDEVIREPLGGAHRDYGEIAESVKARIVDFLEHSREVAVDELLRNRYNRLVGFGKFEIKD